MNTVHIVDNNKQKLPMIIFIIKNNSLMSCTLFSIFIIKDVCIQLKCIQQNSNLHNANNNK